MSGKWIAPRTLTQMVEQSDCACAARLIVCPDGSARLVSLRQDVWQKLDVLIERYWLKWDRVVADCFADARHRQGEFWYAFGAVLECAILAADDMLRARRELGYANDNSDCLDGYSRVDSIARTDWLLSILRD